MHPTRRPRKPALPGLLAALAALLLALPAAAGRPRADHEPEGFQVFASPQADPIALSPDGQWLYVANTTSGSVDVVSTASLGFSGSVRVGVEPVSVAVRPDGLEVWVSNHVSDSVSVIDTSWGSPSYRHVVETVQDLGPDGTTLFDEPVGIAFTEDGKKAYVALSSTNDIAIVDTSLCDAPCTPYAVVGRIHVPSQEPRDIAVRDGRLYVPAFESFNQTELSVCPQCTDAGGCPPGMGPPQCTLTLDHLADFVIQSPNIPGADSRIVVDPDVPDRDLYVYDTATDDLIDPLGPGEAPEDSGGVVSGIGTLIYGIAVGSNGKVFLAQTDARNAVNGDFGDNLIDLDNRMFFNEIARVSCPAAGSSCSFSAASDRFDLEPSFPDRANALATPHGIAVSADDSVLVATASGTNRVFTVNPTTGAVRDRLTVGAFPRGVALRSDPGTGAPLRAYVLNTLGNSVSVVNVSNPDDISLVATFPVGADPTPAAVRQGRITFANALASTHGTFSCESCHPDGNTDQLLWRIGGACFFGACTGDDEIRSTMPVRGLKNTLPLHWDGTLGDPFGGRNGAVTGNVSPSCNLGGPDGDQDCFRDLVDASLSGVMCRQGPPGPACPNGPSGEPGELSNTERSDMATFLASVAYPPARSRRPDDSVSSTALVGFSDFFVDQNSNAASIDGGDLFGVSTCADMNSGCHALPLGVDTNSASLAGFDAPTMRGMTDRTLQFSIGITNAEELLVFANDQHTFDFGLGFPILSPPSAVPWDPAQGFEEDVTFTAAFMLFFPFYAADPISTFRMLEEASTGFSGAVGRQLTLNTTTTNGAALAATEATLSALEAADARGAVNLRATGIRNGASALLSYGADTANWKGSAQLTHAQMIAEAQVGTLLATVTAALRENVGSATLGAQPLLFPETDANGVSGTNPDIPMLPGDNPMILGGIDVQQGASVLVDGQVVSATLLCVGGSFGPTCSSQMVSIQLTGAALANGLHRLQVQNPKGLQSNEMPICQGTLGGCRLD